MFNVSHIIQSGGLALIGLIIFAESGLLVGFFLPGDTLLFPAGFFAAQGKLPLGGLLVVVILAAIAGYEVGYLVGQRFGKKLFNKEEGIIFRQEYLKRSQVFYEKHGGKTVLLSRFIPIIRTFVPIVAGIGDMPKKRFTLFNIAGAAVWTTSVVLLGYWLGSKIPNIDRYLLPVILLVMILSFGPSLYHIVGDKKTRDKLVAKIRRSKS
ncbi:MAG TPA: VTT domain-containing protein [Patescibacteria group bacterium]|nr:VTT domain-containing protein [Patescibacteria group bacterium]